MNTTAQSKLIAFFKKYKHGLGFLYILMYIPWFNYLETHVTSHFHVVHMVLDDYIPFCEYFIVPYMLWFGFVGFGVCYMFLKNVPGFYKLGIFLAVGMTLFLIISTVYPNGAYLRPSVFPRDNMFTDAVKWLYSTDTPTNLFPSIHVYNSIGVQLAISHDPYLKSKKWPVQLSRILMVSIICATVFLKQHSMFDVLTAFGLAAIMYLLVYAPNTAKQHSLQSNA